MCEPPSIPLSFNLAVILPRGALNTFAPAEKTSESPLLSAHRLQPRLPGYLILFAPLAFAPQRQLQARESLSPPVFFLISTHFTAPPGIPSPLLHSSSAVSNATPRLSRGTSHLTCGTAYALFMPSNSEQRLPSPSYRGCWHGVSHGFLWGWSGRGDIHASTVPNP